MLIENNGKSPVQYRLTASAKELFFKCSKPNEDAPLTQGAATGGSMVRAPGSKKTKNTLRIAFNMHILYHHLWKALALESGPTPPEITAPTMQMAIAFVEALETIEGISEIVSIACYYDSYSAVIKFLSSNYNPVITHNQCNTYASLK